ncbi:MAG: hypothetical protein MUE42_07730 [Opitutaceae bacterium]|jgi:predicted small lipoprotein YifL|nr:hypothetical protein [Opitutaceae bacterium]
MKSFRSSLSLVCLALALLPLTGCGRKARTEFPPPAVEPIAARLDDDLRVLRIEVEKLAGFVGGLYHRRAELVAKADQSKYVFSPNGSFYKPVDDGGAALWISAVVPITETAREVAYLTEPVDAELMRICREFPAVSQAYYNDRHSMNRIYPWFDTVAQYPPRMNIPEFNFYYLADAAHNPGRGGVWVPEPYVDPAGRGWMVSTIAPVYVDGALEGVPGLDITIATLVEHYFSRLDRAIAIVSAEGVLVAATESAIQHLEMPPLKDHKYLETVKLDTFKPDEYNVLKSTNRNVRTMARRLLTDGAESAPVQLAGTEHMVYAARVHELGWTVIEVVPN